MKGFIHVSDISWALVLIKVYVAMTKGNITLFYLALYSDKQHIVCKSENLLCKLFPCGRYVSLGELTEFFLLCFFIPKNHISLFFLYQIRMCMKINNNEWYKLLLLLL